jgi:drug/metabolite transporter (DMT)-like permease
VLTGVGAAVAAGLCWGLVFITPLLLADYPPHILAFGRYLAFGLIACPIALLNWAALKKLSRADWWTATRLSLVGNIVYYCALATAIQAAGAPAISALIGTLPIVIAIFSNRGAGKLAWSKLALPLFMIALGLVLINRHELQLIQAQAANKGSGFFWGIGIGVIALAAWTWYPIKNAQWLQQQRQHSAQNWATAQGLMTLPLAGLGFLASGVLSGVPWIGGAAAPTAYQWPLGSTPLDFIGLMLTLGFVSSWLGTVFWNYASARLPGALSGQLIVFETLAALAFAYILRGQWPDWTSLAGIALLVGGVVAGIRAFTQPPAAA